MRPRIHSAALAAALTLLSTAAVAQRGSDDWLERCQSNRGWSSGRNSEVHCELRESRTAARPRFTVDGGTNGGVTVRGWTGGDVRVRAQVQAWARTREEARELARQVRVSTEGGEVRASGPGEGEGRRWSVSYELFVPQRTSLTVETTNGGISVERVSGDMHLQARNGPVSLRGVSGDVHARTANGPMHVMLEGRRWEGAGLDAETRNGPVVLTVPGGYSASLETGTVNGPMTFDIPVTVQGRLTRRIRTELGQGGAPIRVVTTNGPVMVRSGGSD
jgi:DUF4097 and DUF4098 domain-containing protein YvlB